MLFEFLGKQQYEPISDSLKNSLKIFSIRIQTVSYWEDEYTIKGVLQIEVVP